MALVRLLKMERQLRTRPVTVEQLMRRFGVSRRTVWRDLRVLEAAGAQVRQIPTGPNRPARYTIDLS